MREVALGLPVLWTSVLVVEQLTSWLPVILQRSGDQRLSLFSPVNTGLRSLRKRLKDIAVKTTEEPSAILCKYRHLSRIKHVAAAGLLIWLLFVRTLLTSPVPQLETLSMGSERHSKMVVLPQTLFGHENEFAPRLPSLSLRWCDFSWPSLHIPTLIVLSIIGPEFKSRQEYEFEYVSPCQTWLPSIHVTYHFEADSSCAARGGLELVERNKS